MSVGRSFYLDLTLGQRKASAVKMRVRLQALLSNPVLPPDQVKAIREQIARIDAWEAGRLPEKSST